MKAWKQYKSGTNISMQSVREVAVETGKGALIGMAIAVTGGMATGATIAARGLSGAHLQCGRLWRQLGAA